MQKLKLIFYALYLSSLVKNAETRTTRTKILVLGSGAAGISAAKTLTELGIQDFIILDAQSFVGGNFL